jgi:DNA-binding IclR family transcriptional regulator
VKVQRLRAEVKSLNEIAAAVGVSKSSVHRLLTA